MELQEKIDTLTEFVQECSSRIDEYCPDEINEDWWCNECKEFCSDQGLLVDDIADGGMCPCSYHGKEIIGKEIKKWFKRKEILFRKF